MTMQGLILTAACVLAAYWSYSCLLLLRAIEKQNSAILAVLQRIEHPSDDD